MKKNAEKNVRLDDAVDRTFFILQPKLKLVIGEHPFFIDKMITSESLYEFSSSLFRNEMLKIGLIKKELIIVVQSKNCSCVHHVTIYKNPN